VVTDGGLSAGVGVSRREPVDRDEDTASTVFLNPNAVVPFGESIRGPMVVVSTERRGQGAGGGLLTVRRRREYLWNRRAPQPMI
jgi:hypothetical protein